MCGTFTPTNVISVSYGGQEADFPIPYQQRQCNEYVCCSLASPAVYIRSCSVCDKNAIADDCSLRFLKLGLQGVSVFFASGDDGVSGPRGDDNPNGCLGADGKIFNPAFPNRYVWD